jgi:hypothetical protein
VWAFTIRGHFFPDRPWVRYAITEEGSMRLITCPKCNSQFDVATMAAGTSFVCGKCRNVLEVPQAGPVIQPIAPGANAPGAQKGTMKPPPTVSMTPDQVRKALTESASVGKARATPPAQPAQQRKLPKAMQKRAQASASQSGQRAGATGQLPATAATGPAKGGAGKTAKGGSGKAASRKGGAGRGTARSSGNSAAKPSSASARSASRGSAGGGGKKKSQTGLFVGIGIAVIVIAAIAIIATRGGGDGETGPAGGGQDTATGNGSGGTGANGAGGTGTAGADGASGANAVGANGGANGGAGSGGATPAVIDPNDKIGVFLALSPQEQRDDYARKIAGAAGSTDALFSIFEFFSDERMARNSVAKEARKTIADTALRADNNLEWANEASGKKNLRDYLTACRDECPKAFGFAEDDEDKVRDRLQELTDGSPWVDATEYKEFAAVVGRIRTREDELKDNPRLVAVEKQKDWVRKNDLFKEFEIIARHEDPYVVFQQYPKQEKGREHYDQQRMEKARHLAKRDGIIFRELNSQFRNLFGSRFELPKLEEKGRLLRVLIMWNREAFDAWHAAQNSGMSGMVRAYYSPTERHIVHYVGTEALTEQDYYKCANGRVQKKSDQVTFHEGTHQLMHEYSSIYRGAPLPEDPDAEVPVPDRRSMWFSEGLAEFMGSVEILEDDMTDLGGEFFHNRILLERVQLARSCRKQKLGMWPLPKMLLPNNNGDMLRIGEEIMPGRGGLAANLFYAQAWAFVHFSWYYDNGKYKQQFLNYMEKVLKNEHGPEAMAEAFGLPSAEDFGIIEKEYEWYWNLLLRRLVGRKRGGVGWYTPETDAPTGRYEPDGGDDDDGGDYDD